VRFLGVGESNDLAAMYHGLVQRGHEVRVHVRDPACGDVFAGMLQFTDDWQRELGWVRAGPDEGMVLFETSDQGAAQDALRREGFHVVGGSALGDRLEADREFGQSILRQAGLKTAASHRFDNCETAADFVARRPGRYVLKFNGAHALRTRNYVGVHPQGLDVVALLQHLQGQLQSQAHSAALAAKSVDFVLMDHVDGIEVGVGAYFNGQAFLQPACVDFEHKRFFPGDLGELTGEMGTIVSYRFSQRLFRTVLQPLTEVLRDGGYCGYINVNLIANEHGLWPLEFTSRFGYPGYAICEALHTEPWERIFASMVHQSRLQVATRAGFAAGVVLTVPPFPYSYGYETLSKGLPVRVLDNDAQALAHLHFAEVAMTHGQLVTSGVSGYVGVATGVGPTPAAANAKALRAAQAVVVPNLRYRHDIGERVGRGGQWQQLRRWGYLA
jgi:phosphoribosylamine--glycine ligase